MPDEADKIQVVVNVDTSQIEPAKRKIGEFGEHGAKSLLHIGSAGRAFHKVLDGINERAPLLGRALTFALNPVVGILGGLAAGFAGASKALEDFNVKLDRMRDLNARPIGTPGQNLIEATKRADEMVSEAAAKNKDQAASVANSGAITPARRAAMQAQAQRLQSEIDKLSKGSSATENQKQTVEFLKKQLEDAEKEAPEARETELKRGFSPSQWPAFWPTVLTGTSMVLKRLGLSKAELDAPWEQASKQLDNLERYRSALKHAEESLRSLTIGEKENAEALKTKTAQLGQIVSLLRASNPSSMAKIRAGLADEEAFFGAGSEIENPLGGVAYRPLALRSILYRPIKGAPGFNLPMSASLPPVQSQTTAQLVAEVLAFMKTGTLTVQGTDK